MRNKLLSLLFIFMLGTFLYGQKATRENVLLEIGTGTWCQYCPGAANGADDLIANGHNVAVMENHNGDAFANTYSNARNSYYGISGYPTAKFDGVLTVVGGGSSSSSMYSSYLPKVNQRLAVSSDFTMSMTGMTSNMQNCEVVVDVNKVSGAYGDLRLHLAVTESDIPYNWQGMSELNFVTRLMSPNQNGTNLSFGSQNYHQVTLNFTLSGSWDFESCEVIAFLQNYSTKEVHQVIKLDMNDFTFGISADFTVDNQEVITGQSASFTNLSTGDPTSWDWEFEGGIPATYSGQNPPQILYSTVGTYDVSLTVSDGVDSDTEIKTDYIMVTDLCYASGAGPYLYIANVAIGSIDNSTGQTYYGDYTYLSTDLLQGEENVELILTNGDPYNLDDVTIWADWNQDGVFDETTELLDCEVNIDWQGTGVQTFNFNVPENAILGPTVMRIRLKYVGNDCGQPCGTTTYGEVEDYTLNIISAILPPVADFTADDTTPELDQTVYFTDLSINDPDSWSWSFNPTTITYMNGTNASSQNPDVSFNAPGYYTVTFIASNPGGSDQEVKLNYIYVEDPILIIDASCMLEGFYNGLDMNTGINDMLPLDQPYDQAPWNYLGNESVAAMPGDIVDWVLVELRDAFGPTVATPATSIGMQAALLREDGKVIAMDGVSPLNFEVNYNYNLYLIIHHRNHLSVMSASGLVASGGIYSYDFSDNQFQAYGEANAQNHLGADVWGMISGDANADGMVNIMDIETFWGSSAGIHAYDLCDFNGDGEVNNIDKDDFGILNQNKSTYVPQ